MNTFLFLAGATTMLGIGITWLDCGCDGDSTRAISLALLGGIAMFLIGAMWTS